MNERWLHSNDFKRLAGGQYMPPYPATVHLKPVILGEGKKT